MDSSSSSSSAGSPHAFHSPKDRLRSKSFRHPSPSGLGRSPSSSKRRPFGSEDRRLQGRTSSDSSLPRIAPNIPFSNPRTRESPLSSLSFKKENNGCEDRMLVSVTVEGSSGPIRMVVRKGDTVLDLIRLTVDNYAKEGRHPPLLSHNHLDAFELYLSNFSFEGLNKSEKVGELDSRTFFLRQEFASFGSQEQEGTQYRGATPNILFAAVFARKMKKFGKGGVKFWKFVDCMACG